MLTPIIAAMISVAATAAPVRDTIPLSTIDTSCSALPQCMGIYNEPFAPPMSEAEFNAYLKDGWKLVIVPRTYYSVQVEVGNLNTGESEWRCCTLPSGIAVIVSPDSAYARLCFSKGRLMATAETTAAAAADGAESFFLDQQIRKP